jgi:hypothetical protein
MTETEYKEAIDGFIQEKCPNEKLRKKIMDDFAAHYEDYEHKYDEFDERGFDTKIDAVDKFGVWLTPVPRSP